MKAQSFPEVLVARRLLLFAVGVVLAMLIWVVTYDVSGREPPCYEAESKLRRSHPEAVEFRNTGGGGALTHSCEALDADGTVVGRVTYPGTGDWILAAVMLVAPLTVDTAWRRFRTGKHREHLGRA
jgi:hypothetical protein